MNEHKYTLEPYKGFNTRHTCPACKQTRCFVFYIDTETGQPLAPSVGKCNHESNCGYHYKPKQYFQDNHISIDTTQAKAYNKPKPAAPPRPKLFSVIPDEMVTASLQQQFYQVNNFVQFLTGLFGVEITEQLVCTYFVGTSKHWPGASIFWQIDGKAKARTGKIMLYSPLTGKRVKEPFDHITWVHSALKLPDYELQQCLFGEHLLRDKTKPVAIVESEKTAIIASVYLPQFIWLATGGKQGLNAEKCRILAGRTGVLFPDLKMFDAWNSKVKEISNLARFKVSDLLELKAPEAERTAGLDLADYLLRFDYRIFRHPELMPAEPTLQSMQPEPPLQPVMKPIEPPEPMVKKPQPGNWNPEITELKTYFKSITLPCKPVKLNPVETILNMVTFIDNHLAVVEANNGKPTFLPYLERLQELKQYLTINLN